VKTNAIMAITSAINPKLTVVASMSMNEIGKFILLLMELNYGL